MVSPDITYQDLLNAAHVEGVGFKFRGFTITEKIDMGDGVFVLNISKGGNVWEVLYRSYNGQVGKIYYVKDGDGVYYHPDRDQLSGTIRGGWLLT